MHQNTCLHSSCYSSVNSAVIIMRFIYYESAMLCGVQDCFCFATATLVLTVAAENCKQNRTFQLKIKTGNDGTNLFGILGNYATSLRPFDFFESDHKFRFADRKSDKTRTFWFASYTGNDVMKIRGRRSKAATIPNNSVYRLLGSAYEKTSNGS